MTAQYRFTVTYRLSPDTVTVDPATFTTRLYRPAVEPGESGWLFFRNNLWRGEVNDSDPLIAEASEKLGVPVMDIEFKAFEMSSAEWTRFREEIGANLDLFRADTVDETVSKYLGSRIELMD